jgi:hypothetical protein
VSSKPGAGQIAVAAALLKVQSTLFEPVHEPVLEVKFFISTLTNDERASPNRFNTPGEYGRSGCH